MEEEDIKSKMSSARIKSPVNFDRRSGGIISMGGDNSWANGNRGHSTSSRGNRLKARNKKKFFESESEMSSNEPLTMSTKSKGQEASTMNRKNSPRKSNEGGESERNMTTRSNKEGSTNMFRSRRTLANNTWTSSAVGFTRSAEK